MKKTCPGVVFLRFPSAFCPAFDDLLRFWLARSQIRCNLNPAGERLVSDPDALVAWDAQVGFFHYSVQAFVTAPTVALRGRGRHPSERE